MAGVETTDFGSVILRVSGESEAASAEIETMSNSAIGLNFTKRLLSNRIAPS
jgi:hypothetical protein